MPMGLPCRNRWCPNLQPCPAHPILPFASSTPMAPGWKALQALQLRLCPWCIDCGGKATDADHIVPRSAGGVDELWNLQSRCGPCHQRRTGQMAGRH